MKTTLNPALERWNESPGNAAWLAYVLADSRGSLLIDVLNELARPSDDFGSIEKMRNPTKQLAYHHALCSGQQMAISNIVLLAQPPEQDGGEELRPWEGVEQPE